MIVILSGTPLVVVSEYQNKYQIATLLMMLISICFFPTIKSIRIMLDKLAIFIFVCTILFIINYFNYPVSSMSLAYRFLYFISFFILLKSVNEHEINILDVLYKIILFIICVSLIYYAIIHIANVVLPYNIIKNTNGLQYYMYSLLYLENPTSSFAYSFRLSGPFWEPGIFQIYINIALYYWLFHISNKNMFMLIVILASLILCHSTTGYLVGTLLIGIKIWLDNKLTKKIKFIMGIPVTVLGIVFAATLLIAKKTGLDADSYGARFDDLFIGLKLFARHFLFGAGFNNFDIYVQAAGRNRGNSNGLIQLMYTTGLVGITAYFYPFIYNIKKRIRKPELLNYVLFLILFVVSNMTEPLYYYPIMIFLICNEYVRACFGRRGVQINHE